jgi:probable rRNA maturation factor
MDKIFIEIETKYKTEIDYDDINKCVQVALDLGSDFLCKDSLSISIIDELEIKKLNKEFLNKNHPTDVLSFPYSSNWSFGIKKNEDKDLFTGGQENYLGDIFICFKKIKMQANDYKISLNLEQNIIIAHGVLHLLGYDHFTKNEEKEMSEKTVNIIKHLKLDHIKAKLSLEKRNE